MRDEPGIITDEEERGLSLLISFVDERGLLRLFPLGSWVDVCPRLCVEARTRFQF